MQVAKWGNSLAVRLPKAIVDALELKAGDHVEITAAGGRKLEIDRDKRREEALKRIDSLSRPLPKDYRFDRQELHEREAVPRHQRPRLRIRNR
jgi:antitoxin MazE